MAKTLLVVDDAPIMRAMIRDAVAEADWEVVGEACDGQQAVELYRRLKPDAVTLDLVMPHYDGLHGLREIMAHDAGAKVVVVSAVEQKGVLKDAFRLGAADFIVKPFEKQILVETLECLFSAR